MINICETCCLRKRLRFKGSSLKLNGKRKQEHLHVHVHVHVNCEHKKTCIRVHGLSLYTSNRSSATYMYMYFSVSILMNLIWDQASTNQGNHMIRKSECELLVLHVCTALTLNGKHKQDPCMYMILRCKMLEQFCTCCTGYTLC